MKKHCMSKKVAVAALLLVFSTFFWGCSTPKGEVEGQENGTNAVVSENPSVSQVSSVSEKSEEESNGESTGESTEEPTGETTVEPGFEQGSGEYVAVSFSKSNGDVLWGYVEAPVLKAFIDAHTGMTVLNEETEDVPKTVIQPMFTEAYPFNEKGVALVKRGEYYDIINKKGESILRSQGDHGTQYYGGKILDGEHFLLADAQALCIVDSTGTIKVKQEEVVSFLGIANGYAVFYDYTDHIFVDMTTGEVVDPSFLSLDCYARRGNVKERDPYHELLFKEKGLFVTTKATEDEELYLHKNATFAYATRVGDYLYIDNAGNGADPMASVIRITSGYEYPKVALGRLYNKKGFVSAPYYGIEDLGDHYYYGRLKEGGALLYVDPSTDKVETFALDSSFPVFEQAFLYKSGIFVGTVANTSYYVDLSKEKFAGKSSYTIDKTFPYVRNTRYYDFGSLSLTGDVYSQPQAWVEFLRADSDHGSVADAINKQVVQGSVEHLMEDLKEKRQADGEQEKVLDYMTQNTFLAENPIESILTIYNVHHSYAFGAHGYYAVVYDHYAVADGHPIETLADLFNDGQETVDKILLEMVKQEQQAQEKGEFRLLNWDENKDLSDPQEALDYGKLIFDTRDGEYNYHFNEKGNLVLVYNPYEIGSFAAGLITYEIDSDIWKSTFKY